MTESRIRRRVLVAAFALALGSASAVAETLAVTLDKTTILRPAGKIAVITVGNPDIADISVEAANLILVIGLAVGETNLLMFDDKGQELAAYDLVVRPEKKRHVTVHRGVTGQITLSCDPDCTGVENPGVDTSAEGESGGGEEESGGDDLPAGADQSATEAIE